MTHKSLAPNAKLAVTYSCSFNDEKTGVDALEEKAWMIKETVFSDTVKHPIPDESCSRLEPLVHEELELPGVSPKDPELPDDPELPEVPYDIPALAEVPEEADSPIPTPHTLYPEEPELPLEPHEPQLQLDPELPLLSIIHI